MHCEIPDILCLYACIVQYFHYALRYFFYCKFKYFLAVHGHISQLRLLAHEEISIGPGTAGQYIALGAVGFHVDTKDSCVIRPYGHGARAIPKEHAGSSVCPVNQFA